MVSFEINHEIITFSDPVIMGILNVTPDSFSDGGSFNNEKDALSHCESMLIDGADIIDIGGCSTRPNNPIASEAEETSRVQPIIKSIKRHFPKALVSVDTFRASIAKRSIGEGADIINDISGGLFDEEMIPFIGENHIPYVLMHVEGNVETMHQIKLDGDIHQLVLNFFERQCEKLLSYGKQQIILDPGIGFSKSLEANYKLLGDINRYRYKDYPVLIGISRKSLINKVISTTPSTAGHGTDALNTIAVLEGADILRVHDVKSAKQVATLAKHFMKSR
jgi:dihydropteroate synthase